MPQEHISVTDRALHYGDGLFETIAILDYVVIDQATHFTRLQRGAKRLGILLPPHFLAKIALDIEDILKELSEPKAVLKIIVSRGSGGRGYAPPVAAHIQRIVMLYAWPDYPLEYYQQGIDVHICQTYLASPSILAGIKHLNRLEHILARQEWQNPAIAEGLMCNKQGQIIEATMSNVFWIKNNILYTPDLHACGVKGIMRDRILTLAAEYQIEVEIGEFLLQVMLAADAAFVCNSVIGIWPIRCIGQHSYNMIAHKIITSLAKMINNKRLP